MTPPLRNNFLSPTSTALRSTKRVGLCQVVALSFCTLAFCQASTVRGQNLHSDLRSRQNDSCVDPESVWETIQPGGVNNLSWTPCYPGYNFTHVCSKLTVPLDYAQPEGGTASIALVKIPAAVNATDAGYRGPILFNPGGPGDSGVDFVVKLGDSYQQIIGNEFDIIGFDPRGVSRTQPQVNIFPSSLEDLTWHLPAVSSPPYNTTADAVPRMLASSLTLASVAKARINNTGPYLSTAQVARDMLSIAQAFGRDKVQYWGFSYGSVLGATFAAMFPDKIERLIIDGIVDADDYYTTSWKKNLWDTDKGLLNILQDCVDAGPDVCALHESTADKVHTRLTKILENLKLFPVSVPTKGSVGPSPDYGIVEYKAVKKTLLLFLYNPYTGKASQLMSALRALENGDGRPIMEYIAPPASQSDSDCIFPPHLSLYQSLDARTAISCSDGLPVDDTVEELEDVFKELMKQSEYGDVWDLRISCAGWAFRPVERFAGPYVGNTSYPFLLIGNTADPVTPLANAHTTSKRFNGSVVLTQNSGGHASPAASSMCIAKAARDYFRDGILPKEGTVCEIESTVFNGTKTQNTLAGRDEEELSFINAWNELVKDSRLPAMRERLPLI